MMSLNIVNLVCRVCRIRWKVMTRHVTSQIRESIVQLPMASIISNQENQQYVTSNVNGNVWYDYRFQAKAAGNFHKTLDMMSSLMGDLDTKMVRLRNERKTLVINWRNDISEMCLEWESLSFGVDSFGDVSTCEFD